MPVHGTGCFLNLSGDKVKGGCYGGGVFFGQGLQLEQHGQGVRQVAAAMQGHHCVLDLAASGTSLVRANRWGGRWSSRWSGRWQSRWSGRWPSRWREPRQRSSRLHQRRRWSQGARFRRYHSAGAIARRRRSHWQRSNSLHRRRRGPQRARLRRYHSAGTLATVLSEFRVVLEPQGSCSIVGPWEWPQCSRGVGVGLRERGVPWRNLVG